MTEKKLPRTKINIFYQIRGQYFINMSHHTAFSTTEERNIKCTAKKKSDLIEIKILNVDTETKQHTSYTGRHRELQHI
jgi:ribosomal protein L31